MAIGSTIELKGEKEYRARLRQIGEQTKLLQSEMKRTTSAFDKNTYTQEKNRKQTALLDKQTAAYQKELDSLAGMIETATDRFGENSSIVTKLQTEYNNVTTAMNNTSKALAETSEAAEKGGEKSSTFGDMLAAKLTGDAIIAGVKKLAEAFKEVAQSVVDAATGAAAYADDILTMSTVTGLATDTLQEFKYMQKLVDVDLSTITGSLTKLTKNMYTARDGTGSAAEAFKTLGVDIRDENGQLRNNERVFYDIIDALARMENETERDALSMNIFGKSAQALNPLIAQGSEGLRRFAQEAHDMGYVLDNETLASLGETQDALDRWSVATEAIKNQLGADLAPVLTEIITYIQEVAQGVDWEAVGAVVAAVGATILNVIQVTVEVIGGLIRAINAIVDGVQWVAQALPRWWDDIVAQVVELKDNIKEKFDEMIDKAKTWGKDMIDGFIKGIKEKFNAIRETITGVADIVKSILHFSRPDEGPLREYETWMPDFMAGLAKGINANAYKVKNAIDGVAAGMVIDVNGNSAVRGYTGNANTYIFNFTGDINADGRTTGAALIDEINAALGRVVG